MNIFSITVRGSIAFENFRRVFNKCRWFCANAALLAGTWMRASKLASYGMIFSALLTQLAYVKVLVGEDEVEEEEGPIDVTNNGD